ncbi:transglutaminase family protein [Rhodoplanes sp. TEM]|uniref:Transglutaminase family protein n=1 Tax=Rhodoplanes tepidamans TaxID=200616 RepID=A0ABT5JBQ1_RHOTP|nr:MULTISPECIES: transglutaminase family protein [Rhodoplanes]MDC7787123.1 transglutaminase family protein [Rhodoplanes tepidamans]MDC7986813.1 transglutaminase family protein [Rhodoplanes sp. TEM]MDQ0358724.1 transglutaminase-like putative cysteine protease [Rhodoplanes tepidamans]
MTVLEVRHLTTYRYRRPVGFGEHRMMFRPRDSYDQRLLGATLRITPTPSAIRWVHDPFGNAVATARFDAEAEELVFENRISVEHFPDPVDFQSEDYAKTYPFSYAEDERPDLAPYMARQCPDPGGELERWARRFLGLGQETPTGRLLMTLTTAIGESFVYNRRTESGTQDPLTTLRLGRGTCRDFALFMMEAVRALGFAARFVSGYLYVPTRDATRHLGGGSTHAWCQVYLPGAGWVEFDPTNGIIGNRDLIRVAVARLPSQAVPLTGTFRGSPDDELGMTVEVHVTSEDPGAG